MKVFLSLLTGWAALWLASPALAWQDPGLDPTTFDTNVRPQDDLYRAVNGTWLDNTQIPGDKSNYGAFSVLQDDAERQIRDIIEEAAEGDHEAGTNAQKVGDFYKSYMDTERVEQLGYAPLQEEIDKILALETHGDLLRHFGYLQQIGVGIPFGFGVTIDAKDSTRYLSAMIQGGTTLPDRDYYLEDDEKYEVAKQEFVRYVDRIFELLEFQDSQHGETILGIETRLAEAQWPRVKLRDANARYNLYLVSDLEQLGTNIAWPAFFAASGVGEITEINVMTPSFFEAFDKVFQETSLEDWKHYLIFNMIDSYAEALSSDFVDAHFQLHSKTLAGIEEPRERWKKAVGTIAGTGAGSFGVLGEVVGELYVERHFPPEHKARMQELVDNLLLAFEQSINDLTWMTDTTRSRAREKLSKINTKIGYPDEWRDYSCLQVEADDLVGNLKRSAGVEYNRMIDRLGKPINRKEWGMTPHTVNAYYNPAMNEIVFPAAILQKPFFNVNSDDAINYGGIGAVIGHEISHAFDDQGSQYDGDGNLQNWWTDEDRASFNALKTKLIEQYADYEPLPGKFVNGELTQGENIADLSGLEIAFKAYKLSLDGETPPEIAGWTGDQRFFLGWSQVWRRKYREAEMVKRLLTDPHSPSRYRANGPVTNIDAFYQAFEVKPGDQLYKPAEERIKIW
jgi:predicted metalloendopeptidase